MSTKCPDSDQKPEIGIVILGLSHVVQKLPLGEKPISITPTTGNVCVTAPVSASTTLTLLSRVSLFQNTILNPTYSSVVA